MNRNNENPLVRHVCMAGACALWGVMAPLARDAMTHGLSGLTMVSFRVAGAALLFWLTALVQYAQGHYERTRPKDIVRFFGAAIIGVALNQSAFTVGVSLTSPIHATLMTTTLPIVSLTLAVLFFHERLTLRKALGVLLGLGGALTLILAGAHASGASALAGGDWRGDLLCIFAQCSFACYLVIFKALIRRYSVVTCMKWMMLWATVLIWPFTGHLVGYLDFTTIPTKTWLEAGYTVVVGTYVCYILMTYAQKVLRPTVVAMYNYVQPLVAALLSVALGIASFGWHQGVAILLIFGGVYLVTQK